MQNVRYITNLFHQCSQIRKRILQKYGSLFAKFAIALPVAIFCSHFFPPISKGGEHINNILTIFSLLTPIAMGVLVKYNLRKADVYGDTITAYSNSIKKLRLLFWLSTFLLFLLFFVTVLDISKLKEFLSARGVLWNLQYFNRNTISLWIVFLQIIVICAFFLGIFNLREETVVEEIFEGLSKESDKEQLRKHFSYLCNKFNNEWMFILSLVASTRKEDLFFITDDEELQFTTTLIDRLLTVQKNHLEKDVKAYPAPTYEKVAKFAKSLDSYALFTLRTYARYVRHTRMFEYWEACIEYIKYFINENNNKYKLPKDSKIYEYIISICLSFVYKQNLDSYSLRILLKSLDCIMACDLQTERNDSLSIFYYIKNPNHFVMILEKYASAIEKRFKEYEHKDQKNTILTLLSKVETLQLSNDELSQFFHQIDKLLFNALIADDNIWIYYRYWEVRLALYKEGDSPYNIFMEHLEKLTGCIYKNNLNQYRILKIVKKFFSTYDKDIFFIDSLCKFVLEQLSKPDVGTSLINFCINFFCYMIDEIKPLCYDIVNKLFECLSSLIVCIVNRPIQNNDSTSSSDNLLVSFGIIKLLLEKSLQSSELHDHLNLQKKILDCLRPVFCSYRNYRDIDFYTLDTIRYIVQLMLEIFYNAYLIKEKFLRLIEERSRENYIKNIKVFLGEIKTMELKNYFLSSLKNATDKSDNKLLIADISSLIKSCDVL